VHNNQDEILVDLSEYSSQANMEWRPWSGPLPLNNSANIYVNKASIEQQQK
jgi:hypothetical protein